LQQWLRLYGREEGMFYHWLVDPLMEFGVLEDNIEIVNYFADTKESAADKIRKADILYFSGGLPDAMMDRLMEFDLLELVKEFDGLVLGCSAGAMIQLREYHITPDWDYPEFGYYNGIPWLEDFYVEVHYEETDLQKACIKRVLRERGKTVYAIFHDRGAILIENGKIKLLGETKVFLP
jgi:peptidase E